MGSKITPFIQLFDYYSLTPAYEHISCMSCLERSELNPGVQACSAGPSSPYLFSTHIVRAESIRSNVSYITRSIDPSSTSSVATVRFLLDPAEDLRSVPSSAEYPSRVTGPSTTDGAQLLSLGGHPGVFGSR